MLVMSSIRHAALSLTAAWPVSAHGGAWAQVPLQHRVVLDAKRDHHGRVFRALALVDGRRIGQHQRSDPLPD